MRPFFKNIENCQKLWNHVHKLTGSSLRGSSQVSYSFLVFLLSMKESKSLCIGQSVFDVMKVKLKQSSLNKTAKTSPTPNHRKGLRYETSVIRNTPHGKENIPGIYKHPRVVESDIVADEKVPATMLLKRELLQKNKSTQNDDNSSQHRANDKLFDNSSSSLSHFATSNGYLNNKTTLRAKTEFDSMIKDWISTNWLDSKPIIQTKPCHILIHDKLVFDNLNLFDIIYNYLNKSVPEITSVADKQALNVIWKNEMNKLLQSKTTLVHKKYADHSLKEIIKSVYGPLLKNNRVASLKLNNFIKDPFLTRKIISSLTINVKYNTDIFSKLKDIETLNNRNDISIIKDNELLFLKSLDYMTLLNKINTQNNRKSLDHLSLLEYKYKSKLNDYENLESLKDILLTDKLHRNERFLIITGERTTSLEYFRLLKLFNKTYPTYKLKGCVIYLDKAQAQINKEIMAEEKYHGNEMYYVVEKFSDIYGIIEVL